MKDRLLTPDEVERQNPMLKQEREWIMEQIMKPTQFPLEDNYESVNQQCIWMFWLGIRDDFVRDHILNAPKQKTPKELAKLMINPPKRKRRRKRR